MGVRTITVLPFWEEREPREGELLLRMHTGKTGGMVFGFGSHPTTSACLAIIGGLYGEKAPRPRRVLDVGCGTGILGIVCARLGAEEVRGLDVSQAAIEVAARNAANNAASQCSFTLTSVAEVPGAFDLVIANLPSGELVGELATPLCARAQGGFLLVSGFTGRMRGSVVDEFQARGRKLHTDVVRGEEGWCALLWGTR